MSEPTVQVDVLEEGAYWHIVLGGSKGNIVDGTLVDELTSVFARAHEEASLKAVCLQGRGEHFSYGASVEEHLPEKVGAMLKRFHRLFRAMHESSVVTLAAVKGQCLGGGLELATFAHRLFAQRSARLGQPEIALGVFAPVASVLLAERIGRAHAEDLCLSGRTMDAEEAHAMGLVHELAEDPVEAAHLYFREHLLPRSASSLRYAVKAARQSWEARLHQDLEEVERIYLDELMSTHDAREGIEAFLEKRSPTWEDR